MAALCADVNDPRCSCRPLQPGPASLLSLQHDHVTHSGRLYAQMPAALLVPYEVGFGAAHHLHGSGCNMLQDVVFVDCMPAWPSNSLLLPNAPCWLVTQELGSFHASCLPALAKCVPPISPTACTACMGFIRHRTPCRQIMMLLQ